MKKIVSLSIALVLMISCCFCVPTTAFAKTNSWSKWTTKKPSRSKYSVQKKVQYRYKTKEYTTSYEPQLSGYTKYYSVWEQKNSGSFGYVSSFPSGFNKNTWFYKTYNRSPKVAYENERNKTTVSNTVIGYVYYHWCRNDHVGLKNRWIEFNYSSEFNTFHMFTTTTPLTYYQKERAFKCANGSVCDSTFWWNSANPNSIPIFNCSYVDYVKKNSFYKWTGFSKWSDKAVSNSDNTYVEKRTLYRYKKKSSVKKTTYKKSPHYNEAVKKFKQFIKKENNNAIYEIVDINRDGLPELLFQDNIKHKCKVFIYKSKKVKKLMSKETARSFLPINYNTKKHQIHYVVGQYGGCEEYIYKIGKSNTKKLITFSISNCKSNVTCTNLFYINQKEVSYEKYNKVYKSYTKGFKPCKKVYKKVFPKLTTKRLKQLLNAWESTYNGLYALKCNYSNFKVTEKGVNTVAKAKKHFKKYFTSAYAEEIFKENDFYKKGNDLYIRVAAHGGYSYKKDSVKIVSKGNDYYILGIRVDSVGCYFYLNFMVELEGKTFKISDLATEISDIY